MNKNITVSGLSTAIKKTMDSFQIGKPLVEKATLSEFTIKVANTLEERLEAFQLGYREYLKKGFIKENPHCWYVQKYDSYSDTAVLIVQDIDKKVVGTLTVLFEGSSPLPSEKLFRDELRPLRIAGNKLTELSRLVICSNHRNAKEILILLFNYATIYIRNVKNYNCLTIQVNPRHKNYYKSLMKFDEIGREKACPQVLNAPAVLLHISESKYLFELKSIRSTQNISNKDHSLYKYFLKAEQENLVAYYLRKQAIAISEKEKIYFGLSDSECLQSVSV